MSHILLCIPKLGKTGLDTVKSQYETTLQLTTEVQPMDLLFETLSLDIG